jgi:hypothetical protein
MTLRLCKSGPSLAAAPTEALQFGAVAFIAVERSFDGRRLLEGQQL